MTTGYGQSLGGWITVLGIMTFLIFPLVYMLPFFSDIGGEFGNALLFSSGRAVMYQAFPGDLTTAGQVLAILQGFTSLIWIGVFAAILVNRSQI